MKGVFMKFRHKAIVGTGVVLAALGLGATAAQAGTSYVSFNYDMPKFQQGVQVAGQTKTTSNAAGHVRITGVGGNYTANAKMQHGSPAQFGTEVKGLGDNSSANLPNSFGSGSYVFVRLTNNTWTTVSVNVAGSFKSN